MIKQIQRYGNNLVIVFTAQEKKLYGLRIGDKIILDDMLFEKQEKGGKNEIHNTKKH